MQSRWPIRAFGLCRGKMQQALGSLAYCLPHSALKSPPLTPSPPHPLTQPARSGCLSVPFRLLAGALVAYLYSCLLFSGCLHASPPRLLDGRLLSFSGCLPGRPAACRAPAIACLPSRLLAGFRGRFPSLRAACPPPGSSGASRSPLAHCLCLLVSLSCVVRRRVCSIVYLLSIAAAPARRACSPASPDEFVSRSSSPVV